MKKAGKKMLIIAGILLGIVAVLFIVWVLLSPGTIRKYDGEKSLSEKFVMSYRYQPFCADRLTCLSLPQKQAGL